MFLFNGVASLIFTTLTLCGNVQAKPAEEIQVVTPEGSNDIIPPNGYVENGICVHEDCVAAAHRFFQLMDRKADPCQDFSQFACGRWLDEYVLPDEKGSYNKAFGYPQDKIDNLGKLLLEEPITEDDWESVRKAKKLYSACMDLETIDETAIQSLVERFETLGGWPVMKEVWDEENFSWPDVVSKFDNMGLGVGLVDISVSADSKDSSKRSIYIDQPKFGLSREFLIEGFESEKVQAYYKFAIEMAVVMGVDRNTAEKDMEEAIRFEISLAEIAAPREERRDKTKLYNPIRLGNFESLENHPKNWTKFVDDVIMSQNISDNDIVINKSPNYISNLSEVLEGVPRRTIANYLFWRATKTMSSYMGKHVLNIKFEYFDSVIDGIKAQKPRYKTCNKFVGFNSYKDHNLKFVTGHLYVKRYFSEAAKQQMLDMIKYLKEAFETILTDIDWMDNGTKAQAFKKLEKIREFIAYPNEIMDQKVLDEFYKDVEVDEKNFLTSILSVKKWKFQKNYKLLRDPVDKQDWKDIWVAVSMVNAFYDPSKNSIQFPAGILQGSWFAEHAPKYLNYGAIGVVIGHEITHGFDDQGKQFDGDGNLRNWWDNSTKESFNAKAKCIIDQYSSYKPKQVDMNLNGITNQGENIADNGGIKEAYMAYEAYVADNGEEPQLPGLPYTPRQMFWISYSHNWCVKWRSEKLIKQILTQPHSPGEFRILGPLSNSPQFAKDFNCKADTPMNPTEKCSVW